VTAYLPYPLEAGGRVRQYNLLKRLALQHEITLVSFVDSQEELKYVPVIKEFCAGVETVIREQPAPRSKTKTQDRCIRLSRVLKAPFTKTPSSLIQSYDSPKMKQKIGELLNSRIFDLLQIDFTQMAGYLPEPCPIPSVLVEQDIMFRKYGRSIQTSPSPLVEAQTIIDHLKVRQFELAACLKYDKIITMSDQDKDFLLKQEPDLDISVVPNGVDTSYFALLERNPRSKNLVFLGWMENTPNIDALNYFCDQIFPGIKAKIPDARLRIIGKSPPQILNKLCDDQSIEMTGYVDDIRPHLADCAVFIVPLRIASGTCLKILEAMAAGCPIVSTSIGAEGLDVTDSEDILIADHPEEFAQAVVRVMNNHALQKQLGQKARTLVQDKYCWDKIAELQTSIYLEIGRNNETRHFQKPNRCFRPN
jgi:glycosyltransferase involved in cell wall biosynthesis